MTFCKEIYNIICKIYFLLKPLNCQFKIKYFINFCFKFVCTKRDGSILFFVKCFILLLLVQRNIIVL